MGRFSMELEDSLHKKLKIYCAENEISMKKVIICAILEKIER